MDHRAFLGSSILAGGLLAGAGTLAAEPSRHGRAQAWMVRNPRSSTGAGVIYVPNVNGEANAADGNGYISKLSLQGEVQEKEWGTWPERAQGPGASRRQSLRV